MKAAPQRAPERPPAGIEPKITDAEMITLSVMQALLGYTSEARWLRYAHADLRSLFPYLPQQPGYNKRLRGLADTIRWQIGELARDPSLWTDDVWVVDSTPIECARSRETVKRPRRPAGPSTATAPATPATSGGCGCTWRAPCTDCFALTGAKADEREVLAGILDADPALAARCRHQTLIGDKNYSGREFETTLTQAGIDPLRPARKGEPPRPDAHFLKSLRQAIESINDTLKGQLNLEQHGGHTPLAFWPASFSACWPSPQPSGATTTSSPPSPAA